jgi:hypothetical protein
MRIFLGTIAKNIEKRILPLLAFLTEFQTAIPESHIFLYENNSTDQTRAYFPLLESMVPNIHIQSETISDAELLKECVARTYDNKPCRMELISRARNKLLDMMNAHGYDDRIVLPCERQALQGAHHVFFEGLPTIYCKPSAWRR